MLVVPHDGSTLDQAIKHFSQHLVSLSCHLQPMSSDGKVSGVLRPFSFSAFIISVRGIWMLATAGHILHDLDRYQKIPNATDLDLHIVDTFGPSPVSLIPIPLNLKETFYDWISPDTNDLAGHHGLDIGIVLLNSNQKACLAKNKVVPITEDKWDLTGRPECHSHMIVGLPDEFVEEAQVSVGIAPVERLATPPDDIRRTKYEQFVGKVKGDVGFSLNGMSGGLIIGLNRQILDRYWIVAVQSSWMEDRKLTFGCPVEIFGGFVEDFVVEALERTSSTIYVDSCRKKVATIEKLYPGATIIDVTSRSKDPWVKFSPFYPHGDIPIPGTDQTGQSVAGIWQGLKVFENEGVDPKTWAITDMEGIKRGGKKRGKVLGHQFGSELLGYLDARKQMYLPIYRWVLENKLQAEIEQLRQVSGDIVLLDYEANGDIENLSKPLSHASLIARFLVRDGENAKPSFIDVATYE